MPAAHSTPAPAPAPSPAARSIAAPLYFVGALLIVLPTVDLLLNVWPLQPGDFRWRFGVVGLLASYLLTPLLGVAVLAATSALLPSMVARRVVAWVNLAGAALLVAATALFCLDLLQLRPALRPEAVASFDVANARAMLKLLLGAVALAWLGIAGLRASRVTAAAAQRRPAPRAPSHTPLLGDTGASRA
ncbi:MAG TPA: hypothetical protein VFS08_10780 [Gemmatimonadaceae bacterium]|nr:hypothetical protein [Gemmatimonadaceae bacterium]